MTSKNSKYQLVCGMEVHAELKSKSKMFCSCKNDPFGAPKPNIYTCPVCLGMPGALPIANKQAILWTIKLGLALNCKINLFSKFDRKHYFYPDLPKGYQISQYDLPFCYDGKIKTSFGPVRIIRIHLEEDTAKLLHKTINGHKKSLIDFNRSSVPLVEIVTKPDITSPAMAKEYAKNLRDIIKFLDIGDCDMEQGGMRLEANISLSKNSKLPNYKVECKNINSFRFLEQAIKFEIKRQEKILNSGEIPAQETRGYNPNTGKTFSQRSKESAEDYRYFPDPDLPPIRFTQAEIDKIKNNLPDLPEQIIKTWQNKFSIDPKFSRLLFKTQKQANFLNNLFKTAKKDNLDLNKLANLLANKKLKINNKINNIINNFKNLTSTDNIDQAELNKIINKIIKNNPDAVSKYKAGNKKLINFLLGQVMRELKKKVEVKLVREALEKALV